MSVLQPDLDSGLFKLTERTPLTFWHALEKSRLTCEDKCPPLAVGEAGRKAQQDGSLPRIVTCHHMIVQEGTADHVIVIACVCARAAAPLGRLRPLPPSFLRWAPLRSRNVLGQCFPQKMLDFGGIYRFVVLLSY